MTITYKLFGPGMPWEGKQISRAAAAGLLRSAKRAAEIPGAPRMFFHKAYFGRTRRGNPQRVWVIGERRHFPFNVVAVYNREASL